MAQTCPRCGGKQVRQITPHCYECLGEVTVGMVPPGAHGNPMPMPVNEPCRHRFQVSGAASGGPCFCGRDSIGACRECGRRLCGMHGTNQSDFLCGACLEARTQKAEKDERAQFEHQVSVVRARPRVTESEAAVALFPTGPQPGFDDIRTEGERQGIRNMAGLMWAERSSKTRPDREWQLVRHFMKPVNKTRRVSRWLRGDYWEPYTELEDRWLVYVHFEEGHRLCDVSIYEPRELAPHLGQEGHRVSGSESRLYDFRWATPLQLPHRPVGEAQPVPLLDGEPLYPQLLRYQAEIEAEHWLGLDWTDPQGRRCHIIDDVLTQGNQQSLPTVYRTIVIEKERNGSVVDMEICRHDAIPTRFNEIGRELGDSLESGELAWSL